MIYTIDIIVALMILILIGILALFILGIAILAFHIHEVKGDGFLHDRK